MEIEVTYLPYLSVLTKKMREKIILEESPTLENLIERLTEKYGGSIRDRLLDEKNRLKPFIVFLVNGNVISSRELDLILQPLDSIVIGMAAVGG